MRIWLLISVVLTIGVSGMFWGPWLAVTRSMPTFEPDVLIALVRRMSPNMAMAMSVLMPASLLSMVPVLVVSFGGHPTTFSLTLAALVLSVVPLLVTTLVEVPIVKQIETWTPATLPDDWRQRRDRWGAFHLVRIAASVAGLLLLVIAAIF